MTTAAQTMRASVLTQHGLPLCTEVLPVPEAGPGQILVKLIACGVCHSDVHIWKGDVRPQEEPQPFIPGHEGVGSVVAVGSAVTDWAIGDLAGVPWLHDTCGHCAECLEGQESFCQNQRAHGLDVPGAFAEYVVADARFAVRVPAGGTQTAVDPVALAPVMCAGVTAYGAVRRARVQAGETVAIFGCGGLGLYAVQIAARLGARVIAIDRDAAKLSVARSFGAAHTEIADDGLVARLSAEDRRCHAAINFAPTAATWPAIVAATRPRGRIVAAALVSQPVPLNQEWLTATGITITGTSVGTRQEMAEVVAMHLDAPLLNEIVPITLDEASDALLALDQGRARGRYVIRF